MRYVADGDVRTLIDRVGSLPPARACALIAQAASALDAAHARGLVHRDVKPTNMLLEISPRTSRPDHLYLSDFGLAKPSSAAAGLTATGQFFGTVDYIAPEQINGQPQDGRTDQYALACASFEMLSGSPPFTRGNKMAVISAQLSEPPPSLSARQPGVPAAADQVIAKALAKSPADRYAVASISRRRSSPPAARAPPPPPTPPPSRLRPGSRIPRRSSPCRPRPRPSQPQAAPAPPDALAATVRAYYTAINHHRYARAWQLGGRNSGTTYSNFVSGFATTAHDAVTIQSVSGDVVTAQVTAEQTDGTVKTYQGTYTVNGGVITQFNVQQTG